MATKRKRKMLASKLHACTFVSDIAVFVLKRDVKLQLTHSHACTRSMPS